MKKTTTSGEANRRRSQRRTPRTTVRVQCRKGAYGLGKNVAMQTLDISDSGVRMVVATEMELDGEVELLIEGYGVKELKRLGTVRWQVKLEDGSYCIGVEFAKQIQYRDWLSLALPD